MGIASLHPSYVLHQKLLTLWNAIVSDNLPACTRYAQSLQGLPKTFSRAPMPEASPANRPRSGRLWRVWVR